MTTLLWILLSTFLISLISFISVFTLAFSKQGLERIVLILVSLSAGGLLGGAFLHLIPEALEELSGTLEADASVTVFLYVIFGFCLFLIIEQFLHWHHDHHGEQCCKEERHLKSKKALSTLILVGDGVHNLLDGLVIAAAFVVSPATGIVTTLAVALHELPQEIGDFGVLVFSGLKRSKALFYNFLSGLTAVLGGFIGFMFAEQSESVAVYLLPIAAGGFIYLAASDLIPEIKHSESSIRMFLHVFVLIVGIALMYLM